MDDSYKIEVIISGKFTQALPKVKELDGIIPCDGNFHVNLNGMLCLGFPFKIFRNVYCNPSITGFVDKYLVSYRYAISYKLRNGREFIFGELAHGALGIVDDYSDLFGLQEKLQIIQTMKFLSNKKRLQTKDPVFVDVGKDSECADSITN